MPTLKRTIIIFTSIAIISWSGISLAAKTKNKGKAPPTFVETTTIKTKPISDQISSTGTLISIPGITVKPEIAGRVTKIYFKSGSTVERDTTLIEINPDIAKAELEAANADLKLKKLNFKRSKSLNETKDISPSDLDKAEANYNATHAKADAALAKLQLTTIKAPFSGKLGLSQVDEGDFVTIGQNIVNLQTIDPLKVDFSIPETYQSKIAVGQEVLLKNDAYPKVTFRGKVEAIESLINTSNRTLKIRANVPNKEGKLIPGGFVEVTIQFAKHKKIAIPQTSIVYSSKENFVFKIVGKKAIKQKVILGKKDSNNVVIKAGLKPGDIIVTSGQMKIQPGSPIMITNKKKINK